MKKSKSGQTHSTQGKEASGSHNPAGLHVPGPAPPEIGPPSSAEGDRTITTVWVLAARVLWFAIGPIALFLITVRILGSDSGWFTVLDASFWALVVLMVWCRWCDQRSGMATTSFGEPATWADYHRYALLLPLVALVAWIAANALGNHVFGGGMGD